MCYDNHQKELDYLTIKRGNLLEIKLNRVTKEAITPVIGSLNNKCIVCHSKCLKGNKWSPSS